MQLVRAAALPKTPWRNGGGTTTAISAEPADASFDDCLWRVDVSDIARAGPFSHLAGLDRTIVPLAPGLVLTVDGVRNELNPFDLFAFSGDSVTSCDIRGPLVAFNVLTRRERPSAVVARWTGPGRIAGPGSLVFYVVRGGFNVVGGDDVAQQAEVHSATVVRTMDHPIAFEPTAPRSLALSALLR
jgi:environmental stress-induced protein Ves